MRVVRVIGECIKYIHHASPSGSALNKISKGNSFPPANLRLCALKMFAVGGRTEVRRCVRARRRLATAALSRLESDTRMDLANS
jgi:hypothetical protein